MLLVTARERRRGGRDRGRGRERKREREGEGKGEEGEREEEGEGRRGRGREREGEGEERGGYVGMKEQGSIVDDVLQHIRTKHLISSKLSLQNYLNASKFLMSPCIG